MTRWHSARLFVWVCCSAAFGCARDKAGSAAPSECDSACHGLVAEKSTAAKDRNDCARSCELALGEARMAGCEREHRAYLACVARSRTIAPSKDFSPAFALTHAAGISECKVEHALYEACTAPCREAGVVRTGARSVLHQGRSVLARAELIGTGCGPGGPAPARRSPAGSPCEHYSVCSATRCDCPKQLYGYLARACVEGRCADARSACAIALEVVGGSTCKPGR